MGYVILIF